MQVNSKYEKADEMSEQAHRSTISFVSGGVAGVAVDMILYPIDSIKTRLQFSKSNKNKVVLNDGAKNYLDFVCSAIKNSVYKNDTKLHRNLYAGITPTLLCSFPSAALFFATYEYTKDKLTHHFGKGKNEAFVLATSAVLGDVVSCGFRVPFEGMKQRMQVGDHKSLVKGFAYVYRNFGIFDGLYRGYFMTVFRDLPFDALQFILWEKLKQKRLFVKGNVEDSGGFQDAWNSALSGCLAGGIAAAVTAPFDVVKTRLMTSHQYSGIYDCFSQIYKTEGAAKFLSGIGPRVFLISFGGFCFFGVYEGCIAAFKNSRYFHTSAPPPRTHT